MTYASSQRLAFFLLCAALMLAPSSGTSLLCDARDGEGVRRLRVRTGRQLRSASAMPTKVSLLSSTPAKRTNLPTPP